MLTFNEMVMLLSELGYDPAMAHFSCELPYRYKKEEIIDIATSIEGFEYDEERNIFK